MPVALYADHSLVTTPLGRRGRVMHVFRGEVNRYKVTFTSDYAELLHPQSFQPSRVLFANDVIFPEWMLRQD